MKKIFNRRRDGKTDYAKRIKLLRSGVPRIVFRKTNRYIIAQYVVTEEGKDKIEFGVTSKSLGAYGWPEEFSGSLRSLSAAYLTGYLIGKKILKEKKETPVYDIGMTAAIHKTRPYAFLKGLTDAGLKISHDPKVFPDESRIKGAHMKKDFSATFEKIKSSIAKEH